jgi:hypothetical protein
MRLPREADMKRWQHGLWEVVTDVRTVLQVTPETTQDRDS